MNAHKLSLSSLAIAGVLGLGFPALAGQPEPQPEQLDFQRINATLESALAEFSAQSDVIERLNYSIDPVLTDVDNSTYFFDMELALPESPWGSRVDATGTLGISPGATQEGISLFLDADFETDSLAMLKVVAKAHSHCELAESEKPLVKLLWQRHCTFVNDELPTITSIAELHDALATKLAGHRSDVEGWVTQLQNARDQNAQQQAGPNAAVEAVLAHEIAMSQRVLDFLDNVVLESTKDGFSVETPAFEDCPVIASNGININVTDTRVMMSGDIEVKFGKSIFVAEKPTMIELLKGLQNGDELAIRLVQADAQAFATLIQSMTPTQGSEQESGQQAEEGSQQESGQQAEEGSQQESGQTPAQEGIPI